MRTILSHDGQAVPVPDPAAPKKRGRPFGIRTRWKKAMEAPHPTTRALMRNGEASLAACDAILAKAALDRAKNVSACMGELPLDYLVSVYKHKGKKYTNGEKIRAAEAALPYVHCRQPVAIHVEGGQTVTSVTCIIVGMSGDEAKQLHEPIEAVAEVVGAL